MARGAQLNLNIEFSRISLDILNNEGRAIERKLSSYADISLYFIKLSSISGIYFRG
jgi:hypothetical protein